MVSTTVILSSLLGVIGTILGFSVAGWFNLKSTNKQISAQKDQLNRRLEAQQEQLEAQIQSENDRRRADYYLEKKVDILINAYSTLKETRRVYKRHADKAGQIGISQEEYQDAVKLYNQYKVAIDRAAVFFEESQHEILLEVFATLHQNNSYLQRGVDYPESVEYSEFDLKEYNDKFDAAENLLKAKIKTPIDAVIPDEYEDQSP